MTNIVTAIVLMAAIIFVYALIIPALIGWYYDILAMGKLLLPPFAYIGNWKYAVKTGVYIQFIIAGLLMAIVAWVVLYVKLSGKEKKNGKGNEYGSAAFMSDEEFLNEFPSYKFRPNEQECIRQSVHMTLKDEIDDDDVFNLIENDFVKNKQEENPDED